MDARQAQTLQQHALDALGELRAYLDSQEAELTASLAQAADPSDYVAWGAQLDAALRAIARAFPECERGSSPPPAPVEPEVDSVPPTLPSHGAGLAGSFAPAPEEAPVSHSLPPWRSPAN